MTEPLNVLIVEDDPHVLLGCQQALALEDIPSIGVGSAEEALDKVGEDFAGIVISDIRLPGMDGLTLLERLKARDRQLPVVLLLHPRTRKLLAEQGLAGALGAVKVVDPVSFLDMVRLEQSAQAIVTDSGGVQKEAYFFGVPCLTTRDETEWVETVDSGWNRLVGADAATITSAYAALQRPAARPLLYGDGHAADRILDLLERHRRQDAFAAAT
ncbi:UDP-2,3-diacetamido-2,3-dideoxy-D-glucuronate 2-epimerase [compost metagenome]